MWSVGTDSSLVHDTSEMLLMRLSTTSRQVRVTLLHEKSKIRFLNESRGQIYKFTANSSDFGSFFVLHYAVWRIF